MRFHLRKRDGRRPAADPDHETTRASCRKLCAATCDAVRTWIAASVKLPSVQRRLNSSRRRARAFRRCVSLASTVTATALFLRIERIAWITCISLLVTGTPKSETTCTIMDALRRLKMIALADKAAASSVLAMPDPETPPLLYALEAKGRLVRQTPTDGDCFFHALRFECERLRVPVGSTRDIRVRVGMRSRELAEGMDRFPGAWQRGGVPAPAENYASFIARRGEWADTFDAHLASAVLGLPVYVWNASTATVYRLDAPNPRGQTLSDFLPTSVVSGKIPRKAICLGFALHHWYALPPVPLCAVCRAERAEAGVEMPCGHTRHLQCQTAFEVLGCLQCFSEQKKNETEGLRSLE